MQCGLAPNPPRGDAKEGWDNIDIFGWLGYPMHIESILSAARRHARNPGVAFVLLQGAADCCRLYPEHDIFIQLMKLKNTLHRIPGEDLITHLGLECYD